MAALIGKDDLAGLNAMLSRIIGACRLGGRNHRKPPGPLQAGLNLCARRSP
ncbi:hypothetical protein AB0392_21245 [Nonomuraea angiospora]|uniref:hypothetical protein n=1 Tax=Nonomuraea angiospora TaxID=46172 RepID=UPI00344ECAE5